MRTVKDESGAMIWRADTVPPGLEVAHRFTAPSGGYGTPDTEIDIVADEFDRAIPHRLMDATGVLAAAGKRLVEHVRIGTAEQIAARAQSLPPGALDALPDDLAAEHDHYLYGTPKRLE